jgi:hypothetical protein
VSERTQRAACGYIRRGFAPIPVPDGEKSPGRRGWESLRIAEEEVPGYWDDGQGVGVLLGEPSGWRVDIDLDADEAVKIAGRFLPATLTSGRESRPHTHLWFVSEGATSQDWKDSDGKKLVELRSTGRQTIVAPSTHPSGDLYVWHPGLDIAEVPAGELAARCRELATAALIARHVPPEGSRHDFAMALAGLLLRPGRLDEAEVLKLLLAGWHAAGADSREAVQDLEGIVSDTARNLADGRPVVGGRTLEEAAPGMARVLGRWWDWRDGRDASGRAVTGGAASAGALLSDVTPEEIAWLWPGRLPRGKLVLVDGDPGLGKSVVTLDLAARVSVGAGFPDGAPSEGAGVVLLSAEDGLADTIRPRFDAAGGNPARAVALSTVPDAEGNERQIALPGDLATVEAAIGRVGAALVVIDPLMAFLSGDVNSHRDQDVRRALAPLAKLAERTGAVVLVVRHLNKAAGGNPLYRGGGSIGIVGAARMAFVVGAHPEDDERRVLAPIKANLAAPAPSLVFGLETAGNGAPRVRWEGETDLDAFALLSGPTDPEERYVLQEAKDLLRHVLSDGPVPAADVKKEARTADISERTLKTAKRGLGVVASREGEPGKRGGGRWLWHLPEPPGSIKGANPEHLPPKSDAGRANGGEVAYLRERRGDGLRGQSTEGVKGTEESCTLNWAPSVAQVVTELGRPGSGPRKALKTYLEKPSEERLMYVTKAVLHGRGMDLGEWERHRETVRRAIEGIDA